jgi:hypothetical protein
VPIEVRSRDLGTEAANIRVAHVIGENEDDVGLGLAAREATAPDKCEETLAAAAEPAPFLRKSLRLAMLGLSGLREG